MKLNKNLLNILRGMVIGLANIIPGVSGGTMMVSMGIYDQLLESITHLFSNFKKSMRFLLPIFIGIALALALLAKLFDFLLLTWPAATNLGFCGLILGSLPSIASNVKHKGFTPVMAVCFALFFVFIVASGFAAESTGQSVELTLSIPSLLLLFVVGVIAAATMVIPGVSGSMVLMLLGYYEPIINLVSDAVDSLIHFNLPLMLHCIALGIPFALGVAIGIFAIAKLIEWIFKRWKVQTYWAILGLITASPIAILVKTNWAGVGIVQILCGIAAFGIGALAAAFLAKKPEK